jgi:hypothetical protein
MTASDKLLAELGGATASGPRSLLPAVVSPTAAAQAPGVSFMPRQMIVLGNTIYWLVPLAVAAGTSGGNSEPSTPTSPISPLASPTAEQKMDEAIQVVQNMNVASTQTTMQFDGRAQQVDGAGAQAIALSALLSACASRGNWIFSLFVHFVNFLIVFFCVVNTWGYQIVSPNVPFCGNERLFFLSEGLS